MEAVMNAIDSIEEKEVAKAKAEERLNRKLGGSGT